MLDPAYRKAACFWMVLGAGGFLACVAVTAWGAILPIVGIASGAVMMFGLTWTTVIDLRRDWERTGR